MLFDNRKVIANIVGGGGGGGCTGHVLTTPTTGFLLVGWLGHYTNVLHCEVSTVPLHLKDPLMGDFLPVLCLCFVVT